MTSKKDNQTTSLNALLNKAEKIREHAEDPMHDEFKAIKTKINTFIEWLKNWFAKITAFLGAKTEKTLTNLGVNEKDAKQQVEKLGKELQAPITKCIKKIKNGEPLKALAGFQMDCLTSLNNISGIALNVAKNSVGKKFGMSI